MRKIIFHADLPLGMRRARLGWHRGLLLNGAPTKSVSTSNELNFMKKQERKLHRQSMNLGDLIMAVSSCSKNNRETVATVVDLLASGQVLVQSNGHASRAHVVR